MYAVRRKCLCQLTILALKIKEKFEWMSYKKQWKKLNQSIECTIGCVSCFHGWLDGLRDKGTAKEELPGAPKRAEDVRNALHERYLRISSWPSIWKDLEDACGGGGGSLIRWMDSFLALRLWDPVDNSLTSLCRGPCGIMPSQSLILSFVRSLV